MSPINFSKIQEPPSMCSSVDIKKSITLLPKPFKMMLMPAYFHIEVGPMKKTILWIPGSICMQRLGLSGCGVWNDPAGSVLAARRGH